MSGGLKHSLLFFVTLALGAPSFAAQKLTIMSYNVENLFDTQHDEGKLDWTYLPRKFKDSSPEVQAFCKAEQNSSYRKDCYEIDWNDTVLQVKSENLGRIIREVNGGRGPDILVVQEVENLNALQALNRMGLKGLGYTSEVLLEGPDARGIDVGILSRLPLIKAKGHVVSNRTRTVLQADFKVNDKVLSVFANHWPSNGNSDPEVRLAAARVLRKAAEAAAKKGNVVIAAGDFNTLETEKPNAIADHIVSRSAGGQFLDAVTEKLEGGGHLPNGTHWYMTEWHYLDHIFVWSDSIDRKLLTPDWQSVQVVAPDFAFEDRRWTDRETNQTTVHRVPFRFRPNSGLGFADHLPMTLNFSM